eukprot:TRINITY_DN8370_c0_g1_i1.p2 TRINITY_DN8370_c0_g1~~TRINITY_DN8370_c0_g1_i1.p2  ORF type:complete len:154 (-),score=27.51 TRINITY_DN8370_c0_g1_i1:3-410(-)
MKNLALLAATGSMLATALPAQAASFGPAPAPITSGYTADASPFTEVAAYGHNDWRRDRREWREDRREDRRESRRDRREWERERRLSRQDRVWRGNDGRYYCRRDNGTTGLVVGAIGGALLGRTVDTRGDRPCTLR